MIYLLCGNVGTGKSTWAKQTAKILGNCLIVCKDDFRTALAGEYIYDKKIEEVVKLVAMKAIGFIIAKGFNLIIDETHVVKEKRIAIVKFIREFPMFSSKRIFLVNFGRKGNIENRMKDPRTGTREKWLEVIKKFEDIWEEPTLDEGFDGIEVPKIGKNL